MNSTIQHCPVHPRAGRTPTGAGRAHPRDGAIPQAVVFHNLTVRYGPTEAVRDVSFSVDAGCLAGVVGPNGGGKSTLLKSVVGLARPHRGAVLVHGQSSLNMRKEIGFVPQLEQVDWDFPVSVWDVALMGLTARGGLFRWHRKSDRAAAAAALDTVGMTHLQRRSIGELSGGQRRRVLLARAIAAQPSVLLLDEPMNGLDPTAQHGFLDILDRLRAAGATVVMSTHDLTCVCARASDVALINHSLVAYGPPEEVLLESVLADVFGHQLVIHNDGGAYALHHHEHAVSWPGRG